MKSLLLFLLISAACLVYGQETKTEKTALMRQFTPTTSRVLEKPFVGDLLTVWPKDQKKAATEKMNLNFLRPADEKKGHSPINTPYLATTEDGKSYGYIFALRADLPESKKLTSFKYYKEIIDLLGAPTALPLSGETDETWAYDSVSWRLFTPIDADTIEILQIYVARKFALEEFRKDEYLIESYTVSRGTLKTK